MAEASSCHLRILAIGAHPDDIELGCGGTLAKLARTGAEIHALVFSQGRRGILTHADRVAESTLALSKIAVSRLEVLNFADTHLAASLNDMVREIEIRVTSFRPDRVYTMFQHDRHQDHRAVYEASSIACRSVPQFLGYETPSSYPNFAPTVFEEIGAELERKVEALKCHQSQGDRLYMQEEKVRSAAHFRGAQVDRGPSEGFVPYRLIM